MVEIVTYFLEEVESMSLCKQQYQKGNFLISEFNKNTSEFLWTIMHAILKAMNPYSTYTGINQIKDLMPYPKLLT